MVVVKNDVTGDIPVKQMKNGQIAVITRWGDFSSHVGKVVQRYEDLLISIGEKSDHSWTSILSSGSKHDDCRVRILEPGTILEIK